MSKAPKKSPRPDLGGFEEAPQASFEGAPLSSNVSDWANELQRMVSRILTDENFRVPLVLLVLVWTCLCSVDSILG